MSLAEKYRRSQSAAQWKRFGNMMPLCCGRKYFGPWGLSLSSFYCHNYVLLAQMLSPNIYPEIVCHWKTQVYNKVLVALVNAILTWLYKSCTGTSVVVWFSWYLTRAVRERTGIFSRKLTVRHNKLTVTISRKWQNSLYWIPYELLQTVGVLFLNFSVQVK